MAHIKRRALYDLLDDRCTESQKAKLLDHLNACPQCRTQFEQMKLLKESMSQLHEPVPDWTRLDHQITRIIAKTVSKRRPSLSLRRVFVIGALTLLFIATSVLAYSIIKEFVTKTPAAQTAPSPPPPPPSNRGRPTLVKETTLFSDAGSVDSFDTVVKNSELPKDTIQLETFEIQKVDTKSGGNVVVQRPKEKPVPKWPGTLPLGVIRSTLADTKQNIRQCYERALKRTPRLTATFDIIITIDNSGAVSSATIKKSDLSHTLTSCIEQQLLSVEFPPPNGGAMRLVMPIRLYPSS